MMGMYMEVASVRATSNSKHSTLQHVEQILSDPQGSLRRATETSTNVGEDDCIDGCGTQLKCA